MSRCSTNWLKSSALSHTSVTRSPLSSNEATWNLAPVGVSVSHRTRARVWSYWALVTPGHCMFMTIGTVYLLVGTRLLACSLVTSSTTIGLDQPDRKCGSPPVPWKLGHVEPLRIAPAPSLPSGSPPSRCEQDRHSSAVSRT